MTILVDLSQIISAAVYMGEALECSKHPSDQSKNMIKHSVLNSIRSNYVMHKAQYGKMVLACDQGSWRYDVFPQYKHSRKEKRKTDTSGINWDFVSEVKDELYSDLDKYFPYPIIKVPSTEGDDILGVLARYITEQSVINGEEDLFGNKDPENILLVSSDKDNYQIHQHGRHIKQYAPMYKKLVKPDGSARHALIEKIVKGDTGDGIPSIKSSDNTLVEKIRQKPISAKYLQTFLDSKNPIECCLTDEERVNYKRNETLVSYEKIPQNIQDTIISCYNEQLSKPNNKMSLMNFFIQNKMQNLLNQITDFY